MLAAGCTSSIACLRREDRLVRSAGSDERSHENGLVRVTVVVMHPCDDRSKMPISGSTFELDVVGVVTRLGGVVVRLVLLLLAAAIGGTEDEDAQGHRLVETATQRRQVGDPVGLDGDLVVRVAQRRAAVGVRIGRVPASRLKAHGRVGSA